MKPNSLTHRREWASFGRKLDNAPEDLRNSAAKGELFAIWMDPSAS